MKTIEIITKISQYCDEGEKLYESTIRSNYDSSDPDSIISCLRDINDKTERVEEDIKCLNRLYENGSINGFNSSATIIATRVRFARADNSTIEEIEVNDLDEVTLATEFMKKFFLD